MRSRIKRPLTGGLSGLEIRRILLRLRVQKERVTDDEEEGNICDAQEVKKEETKRFIRWSIAAAVLTEKQGFMGAEPFSQGKSVVY
jgi:aspartate carbamoyltransferase catalytic subunit